MLTLLQSLQFRWSWSFATIFLKSDRGNNIFVIGVCKEYVQYFTHLPGESKWASAKTTILILRLFLCLLNIYSIVFVYCRHDHWTINFIIGCLIYKGEARIICYFLYVWNVWPESVKSVTFYIKSLHFFYNSKAQPWVTSNTLIFILQLFVDYPYNKHKTFLWGSEHCFLKYMSWNCNKILEKSLWQTLFFVQSTRNKTLPKEIFQ